MGKFVGVTSAFRILEPEFPKRAALLFSQLVVPFLSETLSVIGNDSQHSSYVLLSEIEWLLENGLISQPSFASRNSTPNLSIERKMLLESFAENVGSISNAPAHPTQEEEVEYRTKVLLMFEYIARSVSLSLREEHKSDAYPVLSNAISSTIKPEGIKSEVVEIVLNTLPFPDESTSWEHILEYRSDPNSQVKFLDLRNWMNEVVRGELTPIEVEQKLEYLMSQYQRHMELHKMKINAGALETVVVSGAEFLEDLVKFKWGKIAKGLFSLKHRRIALLEGELTSPGHEVAYVVKARDTFTS